MNAMFQDFNQGWKYNYNNVFIVSALHAENNKEQ